MFKKEELDSKLLSELQPIAEQFGIRNIAKFTKEKLVYEIIKQQSERPVGEEATPADDAPKRAKRAPKAVNTVASTQPPGNGRTSDKPEHRNKRTSNTATRISRNDSSGHRDHTYRNNRHARR
jgi:transcription termination factor Rho